MGILKKICRHHGSLKEEDISISSTKIKNVKYESKKCRICSRARDKKYHKKLDPLIKKERSEKTKITYKDYYEKNKIKIIEKTKNYQKSDKYKNSEKNRYKNKKENLTDQYIIGINHSVWIGEKNLSIPRKFFTQEFLELLKISYLLKNLIIKTKKGN